MSMSGRIAAWAHQLTLEQVPAQVQETASRHLLDGMSTSVAAVRAHRGSAAVQVSIGLGGPPEALVIGTSHRGSSPAVAMANGTLLHALDFDDTHAGGLVHATAAVLPAAFAVGQEQSRTGAEVLTAAIAGFETVCRLGAAAPQRFHARGAHATSVCGVVAAAVTAGKLLRLTTEELMHAIGIAASQGGGLMEFLHTGGETKPFHSGWASHAGIIAARLAAAGMTGPRAALDGEFGLFRVFADTSPDESVLSDLGQAWELEQITIKPYPACQLLHASLDAARQLHHRLGGHRLIKEVIAFVPVTAALVVCEPLTQKVSPTTPYDAKFSLPWSIAAMLVDGVVTPSTYNNGQLGRRAVTDLAARVRHQVVAHDGADADAPGHLVITTMDGTRSEAVVRRSEGNPENPLTADALRAKATDNLGGGEPAAAIISEMLSMKRAPGVERILELTVDCVRGTPTAVSGG